MKCYANMRKYATLHVKIFYDIFKNTVQQVILTWLELMEGILH